MDDLEQVENLITLGLIGVILYAAYKIYQSFTNSGGTACGSGSQGCCAYSDFSAGNCIGADGTACGWWEYLTATTCYKGAPAAAPVAASANVGPSMIGSTLLSWGSLENQTVAPAAPTPGLPAGYDPTTGMITQ
jgi:hypothetical protein